MDGVEYRLETDLLMWGPSPLTQDLLFWQRLLEPVLTCCRDSSFKGSERPALRKGSEGSERWVYENGFIT